MAGVAVLRDRDLLICRRVRPVMAAEASGEIGMSEIVGISSPGDLQVGKHVPVINVSDFVCGG